MAGWALFVGGVVLTNVLTFAGVFVLAVAVAVSALQLLTRHDGRLAISTTAAIILLAVLLYAFNRFSHYSHVEALMTASRLENPEGFGGLNDPINYLLTRAECVGEIALFFSIGCLAWLFRKGPKPLIAVAGADDAVTVGLVAVTILGMMYLTGLNRVGETARTAMFIYPYLILFLARNDDVKTGDLLALAGIQALVMQLIGGYFW